MPDERYLNISLVVVLDESDNILVTPDCRSYFFAFNYLVDGVYLVP